MGCSKHASQQVSFLVRNPQNANLTLLSRSIFHSRRWWLDCNESYSHELLAQLWKTVKSGKRKSFLRPLTFSCATLLWMLSIPKLLPGNCIVESLRIQAQKSKTCLLPFSFWHTFWAILNCILWTLFQNTLDPILGNEFVLSPFISSKNSFKECIIQRKSFFMNNDLCDSKTR